jgi:hypothetical protein
MRTFRIVMFLLSRLFVCHDAEIVSLLIAWITSGNEHAGINLSAQILDPSIDEVVKQWARGQVKD